MAGFEAEGASCRVGRWGDRVVVPIEASEEDLLGVQTAQCLAQLIVGSQVLRVHRVGDLGSASAIGRTTATRAIEHDATRGAWYGRAEATPACVGPTASRLTLEVPHLEVRVVHLSP